MDYEDTLKYRELVSKVVETYEEALVRVAKKNGQLEEGEEEILTEYERLEIKETINSIVPEKRPVVGIAVAHCLIGILMMAIENALNDRGGPSILGLQQEHSGELESEMVMSNSTESLATRMNYEQEKKQQKYQNVKSDDSNLRVADLGDFTGSMSMN